MDISVLEKTINGYLETPTITLRNRIAYEVQMTSFQRTRPSIPFDEDICRHILALSEHESLSEVELASPHLISVHVGETNHSP